MNNNTTTYLLQLQPLAPFFFGGEQGETADYYLKGNCFPQQTALLGLIRHQLLIQNNLLEDGKISNKEKAGKLIGTESFQYNKPNQCFGVVEKISECFISHASKNDDNEFCTCYYHAAPPDFTKQIVSFNGHFVFPDYNPKNYYPLQMRLIEQAQVSHIAFTTEEIFRPIERPGIDKDYSGDTKEDGYYKQVWLKMEKDFSFALYVTIANTYDNDEGVIFENAFVSFGKESAPFKMTVQKADPIPEQSIEPPSGQNALYLTSDSYMPEDIAEDGVIAVTDTVPFRNVINFISQDKEAYFNRKPTETPCSKRLQFYKRGSFFYSQDIQSLAKKINAQTSFTKVGYNKFQFTTINIIS